MIVPIGDPPVPPLTPNAVRVKELVESNKSMFEIASILNRCAI